MLSLAPWKNDDPSWVARRKTEWRSIKENLTKMDVMVPRRTHKYHKQWFLTGELDPVIKQRYMPRSGVNIPDPFDGAPLFFELWYQPEKNLDLYKELFDQCSDIYTLRQSRDALFNRFNLADFNTEYGMLGGREELFVNTLCPELDFKKTKGNELSRSTYNLAPSPNSICMWCIGHTSAVLFSRRVSQNAPGQYLWKHLEYNFDRYPDLSLGTKHRSAWEYSIRILFRRILDFHERKDAPSDLLQVKNLRDTLAERFDARDFPKVLMNYWDDEKRSYEAGDPYPDVPLT